MAVGVESHRRPIEETESGKETTAHKHHLGHFHSVSSTFRRTYLKTRENRRSDLVTELWWKGTFSVCDRDP